MDKILQVAKVNQTEYCPLELTGMAAQHALACIFELFGIEISKPNIFVDEYSVDRKQLQSLRECIVNQGSAFQKYVTPFNENLKLAEISQDKILYILDELIHKSDQQNSQITISWSDSKNTPIDLDFIKSFQSLSEVVLGETLASVPADRLSIEEAFILYIEAMYRYEDTCLYQVIEDEDHIKIKNSECSISELLEMCHEKMQENTKKEVNHAHSEGQQQKSKLTNLKSLLQYFHEETENYILSLVVKHNGEIGSKESPISITVEYNNADGTVTSGCIVNIRCCDITMQGKKETVDISNLLSNSLIYFAEALEEYCNEMDESDSDN